MQHEAQLPVQIRSGGDGMTDRQTRASVTEGGSKGDRKKRIDAGHKNRCNVDRPCCEQDALWSQIRFVWKHGASSVREYQPTPNQHGQMA